MLVLHSDQMMTCPLDETHRIRKERMQFHLVRCAKNHTMEKKLKCPWNPLHIVDKFAWKNHYMEECEDKPAAVEFLYDTEEPRDIRTIPINTTKPVFDDGENWDAEPYTGTYDPVKNAENKPVLRINIGLSKAKKKQWRQAERKRMQELQANGPLQLDKRPEASKPEKSTAPSGPLRKPYSTSVALSANDSMIDEFNSSKPSVSSEKKTPAKEGIKLRKPHAPSPSMSMKFPSAKAKISNDETISSQDIVSVASGGENLANDQDPNSDAVSMISGISCTSSRRENLELVRQALTKKSGTIETTEDDISHRMANLTTMEKSIRNEKAEIFQQMQEIVPKLVSPKSLKGSSILEDGRDRGEITSDSNGKVSPLPALVYGKPENFVRPIPKCAASFPALKIPQRPISAGRGMLVDLKAFEQRSLEKQNAVGNTSRTYAASVCSTGGMSSVYGYEEICD